MKESQQEDSLETVNADERVDTLSYQSKFMSEKEGFTIPVIIDGENTGDKGDGDARKSQPIADEV